MRVLLGSKHGPHGSQPIGGVQSWIRTVAAHLARRHQVVLWDYRDHPPKGRFDLGILAHWRWSGRFARQCDAVVNVSHGIIPEEQPGDVPVVFTSEGVRDHWKREGPVIRQPIDCKFWTPDTSNRDTLTRFSYRHGLEFVPDIALRLGLHYRHAATLPPDQCREVLRRSACVLATGRAALEAMACGAPVVIVDNREYQGPLIDPDTLGSMARNYSGRGGVIPNAKNVSEAISQAMVTGSLRHHVLAHHDVSTIAGELFDVAGIDANRRAA